MAKFAKVLVPLLLFAAGIGGFLYLKATKPEAKPKPASERVWAVDAVTLEFGPAQPRLSLFGTVVAGRAVTLRPLVAGRIEAVGQDVYDGAVITKGELLVAIDAFDYESAVREREAELAEARATLAQTQSELASERTLLATAKERLVLRRRDVTRRRGLAQRGTTSQKSLDDAVLALNDATRTATGHEQTIGRLTAQIDQQTAMIERLDVALRRAERDLQETRLEAPFAGFLDQVDAAVGKMVGVGDGVARLIDASRLEVRAQLANPDYARLLSAEKAGQPGLIGRTATVRWRIGGAVLDYPASIVRVGAEIDSTSGGIAVFARIDGAGTSLPLRPGAFVELLFDDRRYDKVAWLPESAIDQEGGIYIITEERLDARKLMVVRRGEGRALVAPADAAGLPTGTQVVTTRFPEIGPGLKVTTR